MADNSTAETINHIVDKIGDGLAQLSAAISSHAPQAWELVVRGNHAVAVSNAIFGGVLIVGALVLAGVAAFALRYGIKLRTARKNEWSEDGLGTCIGGCALCIVALIATAIGINEIFGNLPMLIAPDAVTARDLLMKAL